MRLAAFSSELPDGFLATLTTAQLNQKPHQGVPSKNPAPHPALDERNSTVAIGLRASLLLNHLRQSERARYYGSALGRFTSPDEFRGGIVDPFTGQDIETNTALPYADITDPQTLNKYAYVTNNPLAFTDSTGMWCDEDCGMNGGNVGFTGTNGFLYMGIPVTTSSFVQGVAPAPISLSFPSGTTSASITFGTPPGQWVTSTVGSGLDVAGDVAIDIDIFHGYQGLWNQTARVGNALGAATAGVSALPAVVPAATSAAASAISWTQALRGLGTAGAVLGTFPRYLDAAKAIGANAYNTGGTIWKFLTYTGETWTANRAFLSGVITTGQQIWLSTAPEMARYGSYFVSELQYLQTRGINPGTLPIVLPSMVP